jgi:hypothetical protein
MNNSNLKPLSEREISRIEYYCKRISLPRWDINDILTYFIARRNVSILTPTFDPSYINATSDFKTAKSKIIKLGLLDIVDEFAKYITLEVNYFEDYKRNNSNLKEDEIWAIIYSKIDAMIDAETSRAKNLAKSNSGCLLFLAILFSSGLYFIL